MSWLEDDADIFRDDKFMKKKVIIVYNIDKYQRQRQRQRQRQWTKIKTKTKSKTKIKISLL